MQKKVVGLLFSLSILLSLLSTIFFMGLNSSVEAFDQVTAQEAYNMVSSGEATLLDVRTLEEYTFVGSPALDAGGEPVAYLIPWKLFGSVDDNGKTILKDNPDFDALVEQTFGNNKEGALIVMCKVGSRSTYAASRLEQLGFTRVYEIDNKLKELASPPGGCGGFQGTNYQTETNGYYYGYSGYPGRLPSGSTPSSIKVATVTDQIENENDSVSWMDTGLPITQKIDPEKIPKLKKVEPPPIPPSDTPGDNKDNVPGVTPPVTTLPVTTLPVTTPPVTTFPVTTLPVTTLPESNLSWTTNSSGANLLWTNLPAPQSIFSSLAAEEQITSYFQTLPYFQEPAYSLPTPTKDYSSAIPKPNWVLPGQTFYQSLYVGLNGTYSWQTQGTASPTGLIEADTVYTPPPHS
jgi:rhodanese-related sulfurtransferase